MPLQAIPVRRGVSRIIVGTCQLIVRQREAKPIDLVEAANGKADLPNNLGYAL